MKTIRTYKVKTVCSVSLALLSVEASREENRYSFYKLPFIINKLPFTTLRQDNLNLKFLTVSVLPQNNNRIRHKLSQLILLSLKRYVSSLLNMYIFKKREICPL